MSAATRKDILDLNINNSSALCLMAEMLGYRQTGRFACNQLQCNNGAFVSSLLNFFEDNPGAMEAVRDWVLENSGLDDEEEDTE